MCFFSDRYRRLRPASVGKKGQPRGFRMQCTRLGTHRHSSRANVLEIVMKLSLVVSPGRPNALHQCTFAPRTHVPAYNPGNTVFCGVDVKAVRRCIAADLWFTPMSLEVESLLASCSLRDSAQICFGTWFARRLGAFLRVAGHDLPHAPPNMM